jgi:serine/arginine repetitive matrix protein 2
MWSRFTGKNDGGSSAKKEDDESRRRRKDSDASTPRSKRDRDPDTRSVVSSTSTRRPGTATRRRDSPPSTIASFATAFDRAPTNDDLYDDPRDYARRGDDGDRRSSYAESSVSRRDGGLVQKREKKDKRSSKDSKSEKRKSRSDRSSVGGYRGDIVEEPQPRNRSFSGQIGSEGFSQFPGQVGAPMMSGALPAGTPSTQYPASPAMSSHVQDQFPGQDPVQYSSSAMPGHNPFGAAADFYNDQGQSVGLQPGVRPQPPSVIIGQDTPHLTAASATANPAADTGAGSAADFYGGSADPPASSSKPPRPASMPGAFVDDSVAPQQPSRPGGSKPSKTSSFPTTAAGLAGGAALGYAMGHSSSNTQHSTQHNMQHNTQHSVSYSTSNAHHSAPYNDTYHNNPPAGPSGSSSAYYQGDLPYTAAVNGSYSNTHETAAGAPPPKPPRPGKPEKQPSGSNAGLYAAGAAGLAAYTLHNHNSHSSSEHAHHTHTHTHNHTHSMPGAFPGQGHNGIGPSPSPYLPGGMAHQHQHVGPVSRFVDWWKDHEDVQKMEEYTEYIGVCRYCFDPRSSPMDAPRKHHYYDRRRRSDEYDRPSGGIDKRSRYGLKEKTSRTSLHSSGDDKRKNNNSGAGWLAAGLGGLGLATAGKALFTSGRDDFDDTYSIKSGRTGRDSHTRHSRRSRSRESTHSKRYSYGSAGIRHRSRSQDRVSIMSTGVTKDKKDYKTVRRHGSRSSSSSRSRERKSGLGAAIGAGLAGVALGAATRRKSSRSRSRSAHKVRVQHPHRRNSSSEDEHRHRRSQQLRRKSSRSSASGASFIDISQDHQSQSGFLGGFFAAPPPKENRVKRSSSTHKKKKKGFFNFGNGSSSSSEPDMAFGSGFVRRTKTKRSTHNLKKQTSDERLKATLAGLGATAAAIAVAKANRRNIGKPEPEVVAVRERRSRRSSDRRRPGATSQYGDDEWEDLPDDGTSTSASDHDLVYGDLDLRKTQSRESLNSNGSGTNKWGWRWGFGKKRRSSNNLYDNIASTPLAQPATAGAIGAAAAGVAASRLSRHDSESSSQHTLQTVYPIASNDPTSFDARRTSVIGTPQAMVTTGPGAISLQQPQPMHQVPGSIYSTQPTSQQGYTAPAGPPVFSQVPIPPYPTQAQAQNIIINNHQHPAPPALPRRANSSPIQKSSWKKDVAIAGLAATAGAAAIMAAKDSDSRPSSAQSNVRFNFTKEQAERDARERRKEQEREDEREERRRAQQQKEDDLRREEVERRRREDDLRAAEDERRREQLRRDDDLRRDEDRRRDEEERRQRELQRQQDEARKFMEAERLAKIETDRLEAERRRQHDEMVARETREAEDRDRREREARAEAQRRDALEREEEQRRRERRETEAIEAERREAEIRADMDRRRRGDDPYDHDNERRRLEYQPTGSSVSSVATDVRRKEQELQDRERDLVKPDAWKSTAAGAVAAGAVAAITSAAISSHKDKGKDREQRRENWRDTSSSEKEVEPPYQVHKPSKAIEYQPSNVKTYEPSYTQVEPSRIAQDYADEEIFDPQIFKKETTNDVFKDWEDRYTEKPVSQADFFAPKELLENNNLPKVRPVDPNEGAPDLHVYESIEDYGASQPKTPPYPTSYSFTATRDGRGPRTPDPVPTLNLIQPTPPGSRAPSIRSVSMPPSPNIEPVQEKAEPRPKSVPSRVSWGENSFHHFDVPTPESFKEQFISDRELKEHDKQGSQDEVVVERDSPKSGQKTETYKPYKPSALSKSAEPKEIAPSTQYVPDKKDDSAWDSTQGAMSRKSSKKDKKAKKAAAAAAVAAGAAGALTAAAIAQNDKDDDPTDWDFKHADNRSTISNPFSDSNVARSTIAASTVSSIPSMGAEYKSPSPYFDYITESEAGVLSTSTPKDTVSDKRNVSAVPEELHMPGEFIESPSISKFAEPAKKATEEEDWSAPSTKKGKKGKRKSKAADEEVVTHDIPRRIEQQPQRTPEIPQEEGLRTMSKKEQARREKEAKRISMMSVQSWEMSDDSRPSSPTHERDIRDMEPTYSAPPAKDLPSASEVSSFAWGASDDTQSSASVSTVVPYRPAGVTQERPRQVSDEKPVAVTWDNPSSSDVPPRSKQLSQSRDSRSSESSSSKATTAALAGGFAALMGASAKQDQDRIAAEREHARQALEASSKYAPRQEEPRSPPNGTRSRDDNDKSITIPSYAFEGVEEPSEVKTPRRKLEKRHSSGKWSPTVGSPLRSEMKYDDYLGRRITYGSPEDTRVETPNVNPQSAFVAAPEPPTSRSIQDSGYYAPDDNQRKESVERDSDEFFSAGSEEREREKSEKAREQLIENYNAYQPKARSDYTEASTYVTAFSRPDDEAERARGDMIDKYDAYEPSRSQYDQDDASTFVSAFSRPDDDTSTIIASKNKYDDDDVRSTVSSRSKDDPDREERRRRRKEARAAQEGSREQSRDRGYDFDDGGERKRRHRRRDADESGYASDTKSTVSEARSEANGERKSSRRKSRRDDDFDDGASMISTSSRRDETREERRARKEEKEREKEKEKEKEKRSSGLFGLFGSKSKENLADSSKSSKSKSKDRDGEDDEDRKHRRRKHRSDRGSTYGSDDDDAKSTISTSSRSHREKRDRRDRDEEKVHRSSLR